MKILITGGVGFIGTNTAIYFAKKKHQVVIVDNFSRPGVEINEKFIKQNYLQIKIIKSNILQIKNNQNFLKKANVVVHLAGQTAVTTSIGDGFQVRDLLYIDDLIEAYSLAIEKINKVKGEVFNIGGGVKNSFSLLNFIEILEKNFQQKLPFFLKKKDWEIKNILSLIIKK